MSIQRLFYTSRIVEADATRGIAIARSIAQTSAIRNADVGITGSLAFIDGHFMQVLEGGLGPIEKTFERICCDFRHRELKLIDFQTVPERQFAEWGMACLVDEKGSPIDRHAALSEIKLLATLNAREAMVQIRQLLDATDRALIAA